MKKTFILLIIGLVSLMFISCKETDENNSNQELHIGHLKIEGNTLCFDEVEWITNENKDRIKELELTQQGDMPNGYYIYNPTSDTVTFNLSETTVYNFIDWGNDFVGEDEDRNYSTENQDEFIRYLNTYSDKAIRVPFWIEVEEDYVITITEQFIN